jgi:Lon protease-like protein
MEPAMPAADVVPVTLPLCPLGTVLFPGGILPLQIFEVRYLDMIQRCHAEGRPFGIVSLSRGEEVRRAPMPGQVAPPSETFHAIGTMALVTALVRPRPGLILVECEGAQRFELERSHQLKHGLWMGQAHLLPPDTQVAIPAELEHLRVRLQLVLQAVAMEQAEQEGNPEEDAALRPAPIDSPLWQDAGWVANRWAELLPLDSTHRHRLMTLDNPLWRLELVSEWLDQLSSQAELGKASP